VLLGTADDGLNPEAT